MDLLNHPAFQSLVLPLLLCLAGVAALLPLAGPQRAALGGAIGLLVALAVFPGFDWPATARAQKLPWIVLVGTVLAALSLWRTAAGSRAARWWPWCAAVVCWAGAHVWLADAGMAPLWHGVLIGAGAVLLALLLLIPAIGHLSERGIPMAAGLTVASLALTGAAATGGSLLLAQLALMLAVATAVPGLWAWWRPSSGLIMSPAALLPLGLAWLVLATSLPLIQSNGAPADTATGDPYYTPHWK